MRTAAVSALTSGPSFHRANEARAALAAAKQAAFAEARDKGATVPRAARIAGVSVSTGHRYERYRQKEAADA